MYLGRVIETSPTALSSTAAPRHPYTKILLDAASVPDPRDRKSSVPPG